MTLYQTQVSNLDQAVLQKTVSNINPKVRIASSDETIKKIISLRKKTYSQVLPEIADKGFEYFDTQSLLLYTENDKGEIMSTCRLLLDGLKGLSEEQVYEPKLSQLRDHANIAEWGRLIVEKHSEIRMLDYVPVLEALCKCLKIDYVFMFNRDCDVNKMLNGIAEVQTLKKTDISFGSKHRFTAMLWTIKEPKEIYKSKLWDQYAKSFMTITTHYQSILLKEAASQLYGDIIDCGSGCAKIAPFLSNQEQVKSYTAIDASTQMCHLGQKVLDHLQKDNFKIIETSIEEFSRVNQFDSAVSINSMYTWPEPLKILKHIHLMLKPKGKFVLATINLRLDMPKLLRNIRIELVGHPDAEHFIAINETITDNNQANILSLDQLVRITQHAGFKLLSCNETFYEGGLSFLLLEKL